MHLRSATRLVGIAVAALLAGCGDLPKDLPTEAAFAPLSAAFSQSAAARARGGLADASDRLVAGIESGEIRANLRNHIAALDAAIADGDVDKAQNAFERAERALNQVGGRGQVLETPEVASIRQALATARLTLYTSGN